MSDIMSAKGLDLKDIPILTTSRLRLRPYRVSDLDTLAIMWGDETYTRFIGNRTRSRSEVWQTLQRMIGSWALLGYGYWLIETHAGEFIGEAGLMEGFREITPSHIGTPEAGWGITPAAWGQGYASEAVAAVLDWRDTDLPGTRTVCIIEPGHAASIRIAEKHGFVEAYTAKIGGDPIIVFERLTT